MAEHEKYMRRCLEIARMGAGSVAPNPMVGCVIVHDGKIIGEGFHVEYGGPHAEVNAINLVKNQELLHQSTLYVNLEPCSHHGKTPPCSNFIAEKKIPRVVIGSTDPNPEVSEKGIGFLRKKGVEVIENVLFDECRWLNRRFFTFQEKKRPYIILKWAQTPDGFIDIDREPGLPVQPTPVSGTLAQVLVHKTRAEEVAILVGANTVKKDNPALTTRLWSGKSPVRLVIDKQNRLSRDFKIFDRSVPTILFTENPEKEQENLESRRIDFSQNVPQQILNVLYEIKIQSVIIEGGTITLQHFINEGLWDEAHIYTGPNMFFRGVKAPSIDGILVETFSLNETLLSFVVNKNSGYQL